MDKQVCHDCSYMGECIEFGLDNSCPKCGSKNTEWLEDSDVSD